ncbi:interleukin-15 receptor subunit alpha isoform X10 [Ctenopharyngodon idella]|uniref:IL-15 receptor alpha chain isoform 4 n=1 Tax=Ctenopharyngodon idella TaxID=7959 RepID=A0A4Y1JSD4_CTEID|nr:interleukin-15 receptor subunit alpha isoform X10 [Ctenopharyngodon idella]ANS56462.1 IL-15 receptor alpha chain isoform 4 [Ctenopharyngodon idella]
MHVLVILIFMTAADQHNFARASGSCGPPNIPYTVPVTETYPINETIRIQCVEGYVRKAGTSSMIRCTENDGNPYWQYVLNFECIPDPKKPQKVNGSSHDENKVEATSSNYTSTVSSVTSIIIICLAATVFFLWWRWRHRERSDRNGIQLYHNVCTSEHCSADPNKAANNPTSVSVNDTNQPQTGSTNGVDTSDKLLPQTDSC